MKKRDQFVTEMRSKLDEWNADIDRLTAKVRQKQARASNDVHARLAELRAKQDRAANELDYIQGSSDDVWTSLKAGAERIWDDLKQTVEETKKSLSD